MIRVLLVLVAAAFAFTAMIAGFRWGWLGIEPSPRTYHGCLAASVMFGWLSFLPWSDWGRRYSG